MDNHLKQITLLLLILFLFNSPSFAKKNPDQVVLDAAKSWLNLLDKNNLEACYENSARFVKVLVKKDQWLKMLQQMQQQTGVVESRYVIKKEYEDQLAGLPKGAYTVLIFESTFTNGKGHEKVIMIEESGKWKVAGYSATNK